MSFAPCGPTSGSTSRSSTRSHLEFSRRWLAAFLLTVNAMSTRSVMAQPERMEKQAAVIFEQVDQRAKQIAGQPFVASTPLPRSLQDLDYDAYRLIAFEHQEAIWKQTHRPFWLECFHRGYLFSEKVSLNLVEDGRSRPLPFDRKMFQYRGTLADLAVPQDLGFAGFRVLGKFNKSPHFLEIASFLGASYFRAIADGQTYGTSARGLAIDIGMPRPEEFPAFREFWIAAPEPGDRDLWIWAVLDSPCVAGAYQFVLQPRTDTACLVKARLYFRHQPSKVGLAPLTSMWSWGDGRQPPPHERRPEVHDADGLLVATADDQWIWRPLVLQSYSSVSHFDYSAIRGFGLLQRDRDASHYLDEEAKYHLRPSVWIEPTNDWGAGAVELLEFPAEHEGTDNVAAWWIPRQTVPIGKPWDLEYRVTFMSGEPGPVGLARAVATRVIRPAGQPLQITIEFTGDSLRELPDKTLLQPDCRAVRGEVRKLQTVKQPDGSWRFTFEVHPAGSESVELWARLQHADRAVTETWRYLCPK